MHTVDDVLKRLFQRGSRQYGDESVSQLAHALQCATLAERSGAGAPLIVAALLHDFGHVVVSGDEEAARRGIDAVHERLGAEALAPLFGPAVTEPIRLHVAAKRYLCATEPAYAASLSAASQRSLELQGGILTGPEARAFLAQPHAAEAIMLRRWDEEAKDPGCATQSLEHFLKFIEELGTGA